MTERLMRHYLMQVILDGRITKAYMRAPTGREAYAAAMKMFGTALVAFDQRPVQRKPHLPVYETPTGESDAEGQEEK